MTVSISSFERTAKITIDSYNTESDKMMEKKLIRFFNLGYSDSLTQGVKGPYHPYFS